MSEVAAHDLTEVRICRIPGCTNDASDAPAAGGFAGKCSVHREQTRLRMVESQRARADAAGSLTASRGTTNSAPDGALEAAARKLPALARKLESAQRTHANTKAARADAFEAFKTGLEELQATAREVLGQ